MDLLAVVFKPTSKIGLRLRRKLSPESKSCLYEFDDESLMTGYRRFFAVDGIS